jgi:hypothetical protein
MEHPVSSPEDAASYTLPRYTRQWVYTFLALAVAFTCYFKIQYPLVPKSPRSRDAVPVAQESYWFFALQLPNPEPAYAQGELHRKSSDWFNSLRLSGFHPMLLSDVKARMSKGMLLPEKTIVLSIDEALLTTYNAYEPLLRDFKFPAVLMTSLKPLREGDRGYLSYNAVQKLPDTGFWDVIFLGDHAQPQIQSPQEVPVTLPLPPEISPWSSRADRSLANQLSDLQKPRRLSIDWQWTGQDLVNRLQAETPVHPHGSRLGARQVLGRLYGVVLSKETNPEDRFSLAAPADQRGRDIGWLGTRGLENFQIHFSLEDATGQVWFLLRSTGDRGDNIRVGFFDGKVTIKEKIAGRERLLGMTDWPRVFPWMGTIQLRGFELCVMRNGQAIMVSRVNHRTAHRSQSMLQLMVYDQLYGAAQARNVSIEISPLLDLDTPSTEGPL